MANSKEVLYSYNQVVSFKHLDEIKTGSIMIIDPKGTFEQNEEPSYDILVSAPAPGTLYKHVRQSLIL